MSKMNIGKYCRMSAKDVFSRIKLSKLVMSFFVVVLAFAVVNWVYFQWNTTSFMISDQMNKHLERYDFLNVDSDLANYHRDVKDTMIVSFPEFNEVVNPDLMLLDSVNRQLRLTNEDLVVCETLLDSLYRLSDEARVGAIDTFRTNGVASIQNKIDDLNQFLDGKDSTKMTLQGMYVEKAQLEYQLAVRNLELQNYIIEHYGSFIPDSLSSRLLKLNEEYTRLSGSALRLQEERRDVILRIRVMTKRFHEYRRATVGFWDFLYYSLCVGTTVSFGDIAPNDGTTRALAGFEIFLCLILVGLIVGKLLEELK